MAGSFIQTLTMVDIATGWTECLLLVTRDGSLVVEAIKHAQSLFPWLLRGVDFDNDSAFMNDVSDTIISDIGKGLAGGGIVIAPTGGRTASQP